MQWKAIWQRLLTHLCVQTAERGSLRIYARLPVESDELQLFRNVGFLEYGQVVAERLSRCRGCDHDDILAIENSLHGLSLMGVEALDSQLRHPLAERR